MFKGPNPETSGQAPRRAACRARSRQSTLRRHLPRSGGRKGGAWGAAWEGLGLCDCGFLFGRFTGNTKRHGEIFHFLEDAAKSRVVYSPARFALRPMGQTPQRRTQTTSGFFFWIQGAQKWKPDSFFTCLVGDGLVSRHSLTHSLASGNELQESPPTQPPQKPRGNPALVMDLLALNATSILAFFSHHSEGER